MAASRSPPKQSATHPKSGRPCTPQSVTTHARPSAHTGSVTQAAISGHWFAMQSTQSTGLPDVVAPEVSAELDAGAPVAEVLVVEGPEVDGPDAEAPVLPAPVVLGAPPAPPVPSPGRRSPVRLHAESSTTHARTSSSRTMSPPIEEGQGVLRPPGDRTSRVSCWVVGEIDLGTARVRWLLAVEGALFAVLLGVALITSDPTSGQEDSTLPVLAVGAAFLTLQALILLPVARPKAKRARGVPVFVSLGIGALLCAALVGGFAMAVADALRTKKGDDYVVAGLLVAAVAWPIGTALFVGFARARPGLSREALLGRVTRGILKGTAFEALAVLPLDAMIRRKSDCYCVAGSVLAWAVCVGVGLIVFGPAALLPAITRHREAWYQGRCDACGGPLTLSGAVTASYRSAPPETCGACGGPTRTEPGRAG